LLNVTRRSQFRNTIVRWAGLSLALAVCVCGFTRRAHAGCGDYVVLGTANQHVSSPSAPLPLQRNDSLPIKQKVPCSGPNCSRGDDTLPLAPFTVVSPAVEEWGSFSAALVMADAERHSWLTELPLLLPDRCSSPLERPPRRNAD
jgi:hypothetical protein